MEIRYNPTLERAACICLIQDDAKLFSMTFNEANLAVSYDDVLSFVTLT